MPSYSEVFDLPAPLLADGPANIETAVAPLRDALEAALRELQAGAVGVGVTMGWVGTLDPPVDRMGIRRWMLKDGRLIDRTIHAEFFSMFGHTFNGGVDPGGNMVRIPDARGRTMVAPDNMGTAMGAASRIPNSSRALGQSGGAERHQLTAAESGNRAATVAVSDPGHGHGIRVSSAASPYAALVREGGTGNFITAPDGVAGPVMFASTGITASLGALAAQDAHPNMQPYLVENMIVRVR